jgi:hypothetical protein
MKFLLTYFLALIFIIPSSIYTQEANNSTRDQVVKKISETIHPNMAKIWNTFFSNFDPDKITDWNFSEKTGSFIIRLRSPLKFWIPASKNNTNEPRPGSILIFGLHNKVTGRLNQQKRSIEFDQGFSIYCKYKMGFFTIPMMVDVYSFTYKNDEIIIIEAGKAGVSEKRSKSFEKYLNAWSNPGNVVTGDHEAFLNFKCIHK